MMTTQNFKNQEREIPLALVYIVEKGRSGMNGVAPVNCSDTEKESLVKNY